jgi:hypothetical protein
MKPFKNGLEEIKNKADQLLKIIPELTEAERDLQSERQKQEAGILQLNLEGLYIHMKIIKKDCLKHINKEIDTDVYQAKLWVVDTVLNYLSTLGVKDET